MADVLLAPQPDPWVGRFMAWATGAEEHLDFQGAQVPVRVQAMVRAMWPATAAHQNDINAGWMSDLAKKTIYPCCPHCGGLGDPMRSTDDPVDGLPEGCPDSPHTEPCVAQNCQP